MKKFVVIGFMLLAVNCVFAQLPKVFWVRFEPKQELLQKKYQLPLTLNGADTALLIQELLLACYQESFLSPSISLEPQSADTLKVLVQTGKTYQLRSLGSGNVPLEWIEESGFRMPTKNAGNFKPNELKLGLKLLLQYAENIGYPFASLSLDSIVADTLGISAQLKLEKNEKIYFDSLDFGGDAKVKKTFLLQYSGIKPGMAYQESLLSSLDAKLSELPYIQVVRPMGIYFYGNKAKPYVYINHKKASSFDGVIGFAPNSSLNNKLIITGDLNLKLENILSSGKSIDLSYKGYLNNSQDLRIRMLWPYFLRTKFGLDYTFRLNKFDSSWFEIFQDIGLQYRFTGNNYLKLFYQIKQIQVLNIDTQFVKNFGKLPAIHDIKSSMYGIGLRKSTLNYFRNPSKGYLLETDIALGNRKIIPNESLLNLDLGNYSIYDSVEMNSLQYKVMFNLSVYKKISRYFVLHTQVNSGLVYAKQLFINELFRIGGLKTLKGFDEQSIFASAYGVVNVECRYLFQQNSNFVVFWNGACYTNEANNGYIQDKPWGLGAGMNLETGAGVFSMYYAIGSQKGNPLEFRSAKIHFGLLNFF